MTEAYPLHWPDGWPRTKSKQQSRFKTTLHNALNNVGDELRRFAADSGKKMSGVVISSNYSLNDQRPADSGVAVYFTWDEIATCIAVDRYEKIEDNLQAIMRVVEAERTKMRHGGLNIVRAAFRGYAALPPPSGSSKPWHIVLMLKPDATRREIDQQFRDLAKRHHPDRGGEAAKFHEIEQAHKRALKERP